MKISHELPISLLHRSEEWNDYDYCLPIFLDKYPEYSKYFLEARDKGRFIIMDNSLFEGYSHTVDELIEKINIIQPDIFIVPDAWNDPYTTADNAHDWITHKEKLPSKTNLMIVLQGNNYSELKGLYEMAESLGYKYFAFNHSSNYYNHLKHPNKLVNQMIGRISTISKMKKDKIIKDDHYIHLLGASLPQEFIYYNSEEFNFIKSVDTSSPIINGALGIQYNEWGLLNKPSEKIEEFFINGVKNSYISLIENNVKLFKQFCNK